jgi:cellulose synthase/poly-beta-1,6-N-acetylglucosamine synthase-like glycosyltransferase
MKKIGIWVCSIWFLSLGFAGCGGGHNPSSQQPNQTSVATLVVPCYNEGENVRETLEYLANQDYPDFEIIAINDGSRDDTGCILDELTNTYPQLRVLHLPKNQGKAMGLRMAALAANSDYLICIDGDALLDRYATRWLMWHLVTGPRVGAVTGNPRIRNRSTLLGRVQVGVFIHHWSYQARTAHLWPDFYRIRSDCRVSPHSLAPRRLLE